MTKTLSPPYRSPRISVPVSPGALEAFQRLAKAGNMSTGKAIAEWLDDTVEAVSFMAVKMEQAKEAPKKVIRELHAYALGLADETGDMMRVIQAQGVADRAAASKRSAARPDGSPIPPPCNTGGKVPHHKEKTMGGKSS